MRILTAGKTDSGFTLIELIVVALLISLSLGLVVGVNFKQRDSLLVRSTARQLYSYLLAARSQAILHDQVNRCWYLPKKNEVVTDIRQRTLIIPPDVALLMPDEAPQVSQTEKILLVYYYPDGSAGGGEFCLQAAARSIMLRVDPLLGFVTILSGCDTTTAEPVL